MSKSVENTGTKPGEQPQPRPRAIVHKQILDAARSNPTASIEDLASNVSGASPTLVEQVIGEYGDPAESASQSGTPPESSSNEQTDSDSADEPGSVTEPERSPKPGSSTDPEPPTESPTESKPAMNSSEPELEGMPTVSQLSEKQRETLRVIREHPEATQGDLADRFDVTSATISQRVNAIDGFEWTERTQFVETLFESDQERTEDHSTDADSTDEAAAESGSVETSNTNTDPRKESPETTDEPTPKTTDDTTPKTTDRSATSETGEPKSGEPGNDGEQATEGTDETDELSTAGMDETDEATTVSTQARTDGAGTETRQETPPDRSDLHTRIETLTETVARLEDRLETPSERTRRALEDPELVHKVAHACLSSEQITKDEELRILESLLAGEQANRTLSE